MAAFRRKQLDFLEEHKEFQYKELTDKEQTKLVGEPEPGKGVRILWLGEDWKDQHDRGYLFAIPGYNKGVDDYFVHIPNPKNPGGMDAVEDEFIHLSKLLKNEHCLEVQVI